MIWITKRASGIGRCRSGSSCRCGRTMNRKTMICSRVIIFFCRVSNVARGFPVPSGYTAQKMARQGACDVVQMHDCSG